MRLHKCDQLRICSILDIVEAEPAIRVRIAIARSGLDFGVHDHKVANNADFVRVRPGMRRRHLADDLEIAGIGNIENRGPVGPMLMAYVGVSALDHDLSAPRKF